MSMTPEPAGLFIRDDDESIFSRDIDGQLVRLDLPTESDYTKTVSLQVDGVPVTVPMAAPLTDSEGNIVLDMEGQTTPRYTTIYDAAVKLCVLQPGDEAKIPIPTLCHQPHMVPVAVCRLCVVQIYGQKRGRRAAERKLLPACQHPVKEGMEVFTMQAEGPDGERVRQTVKVLSELLAADHLKPAITPELAEELAPFNELGQMAGRCGADCSRFKSPALTPPPAPALPSPPPGARRHFDLSSPVFAVDHSACILCDRCVRACTDVMGNNVIGRTGKGPTAGIGFDLNDPMGESSCVKCGECMVSCPTTAITFKPVGAVKPPANDRTAEVLPAADLIRDPLFAGIPPKFLLWQKGLVIRRKLKPHQELCRQGDAGNTAFIIKDGKLQVTVFPLPPQKKGHTLGTPEPDRSKPVFQATLTPANMIVGEMSCITGTARSADVMSLDGGEVWEVRRNVLDRLMRLPSLRSRFESEYRHRALDLVLEKTDLFRAIAEPEYQKIVNFLRERLSFVRLRPGQTLFEYGDRANFMYLVRLGYVRVGPRRFGTESGVISCGPGSILGEIGLLAFSSENAGMTDKEADHAIESALMSAGDDISSAIPVGTRTATCTALGYLELARLGRTDFLQLIRQFPVLRTRLVRQSMARLRNDRTGHPYLTEYVEQGLYEGQSILVLDLEKCTRCDECTRGCVEQHGTESHGVPLTRLLRDGKRFDRFLVATSCRSCTNAHCMTGCPVDAIHRGKHMQIVIEDHCIGCGLCASNCPYGSISLMPNHHRQMEVYDPIRTGLKHFISQPKAVNCDLCDPRGLLAAPEPQCVTSCPHDAAMRVTGEDLLQRVMRGVGAKK